MFPAHIHIAQNRFEQCFIQPISLDKIPHAAAQSLRLLRHIGHDQPGRKAHLAFQRPARADQHRADGLAQELRPTADVAVQAADALQQQVHRAKLRHKEVKVDVQRLLQHLRAHHDAAVALRRRGLPAKNPPQPLLLLTGDKQLGMFYIDRLQPDLVIVDMHMKKGAAIELLRYAKALHNPARVIMMTDRDDSEELMATVQLQAEGYLSKLIEVQELLSQIKRVCNGKVVVSNRLMAALTRAFRDDTGEVDRDLNCLTSREKDVLKCLSIGMSNQQTGEYLSIQLGTVKVHVKHILKKMGFASRTQAALWARDRGVTI